MSEAKDNQAPKPQQKTGEFLEPDPNAPENPSRRNFFGTAFKIAAGASALIGLGRALTKDQDQLPIEPAKPESVKSFVNKFDTIYSTLSDRKQPNWREKAWETHSFQAGENHFYLTKTNDGRRLLQIVENPAEPKTIYQYRVSHNGTAIEKVSKSDLPAEQPKVPVSVGGITNPIIEYQDAIEGVLVETGTESLIRILSNSFEGRTKNEQGETIPSSFAAPVREARASGPNPNFMGGEMYAIPTGPAQTPIEPKAPNKP